MKLHELFNGIDDTFGLENEFRSDYVDTDKIISMTNEKLGISQKKPFPKIKFIFLFAAAFIALSAVIAVSAVIKNNTADTFDDIFTGEPNAVGLYESRHVSFSSPDENLQVDVMGITADNQNVYAMLKVTHKDNSPFAEDGYIYGLYAVEGDFYDDNYRSAIKCRTKDGEPLGNIGIAGGYTNKYFLSDDRTEMKIYLSVDVRGLNAQGGEITYKNVNYTAQKIYDIKESFDEVTNQTWIDNMDLLENESENYHIIRTGDSYVLCKTVQKTFDLPFEITFSLDYSVENNIWLNPSRINATNILTPVATDFSAVISNFSLDIKSSCSPSTAVKATPDENFHLVNFRDIDSKNSVITLDDGTSYYLVISSAGGGINENTNRFEEHIKFQYKTVPDPALADEIIVIDTRKIKQITINGDVIYTKGEFKNVDKADIP